MAIDRASRDQLAEQICHLAAGLTTNKQFERSFPFKWDDPAIFEVWMIGIWPLYSDLWTHRLRGRHRLAGDERAMVVRCIAFLYSDCPYLWPSNPDRPRSYQGWDEDLDMTIWPFRDRWQLARARAKPRLLMGSR